MNEQPVLKKGQTVRVMRRIGKNGVPTEVIGTFERFSFTITINGQPTAVIRYEDGQSYWYPIDELILVHSQDPIL